MLSAFAPLCHTPERLSEDRGAAGSTAFTRNWVEFSEQHKPQAREARRRFLDRYEWPSLWETSEVHSRLFGMRTEEMAEEDVSGADVAEPEY